MTETQFIDGILWCFLVFGALFLIFILVSGAMWLGECIGIALTVKRKQRERESGNNSTIQHP